MPEIDEVRNIANKTNASIIGISETKLDETILSSDPINQGEVVVLLLTLKVRLYIVAKTYSFCSNAESIFVDIFFLNLSQSYWVSYTDHPINQIPLNTLIIFSRVLSPRT